MLRGIAKELFFQAFMKTGLPRDKEISVLDVGCGLGFLSYVVTQYFPKAKILGIDTFENSSLLDSDMRKAEENMEHLGIRDRVFFKRLNVLDITEELGHFDIVVSNLVFHNLGRRRFEAYEKITKVMKPSSFFINGDIFFGSEPEKSFEADISRLSKIFKLIFSKRLELKESLTYYIAVLTRA